MRHLKVGKIPSILRQGGFIGLGIRGSGPAFGGGQSGPGAGIRSLFSNGEAGAIFIAQKPAEWGSDPNLVTMYQDSAGTTPVTALEQQVGLQLDVRPIFLGPELVTNGRFATDVTGWTGDGTSGGTDTTFSWGTAAIAGFTHTPASLPAPLSFVVSGLHDLSAPSASGRYNGAATGSTSAAMGGTFGSYPLNYGARNNAGGLFFTGDEFVSIVRGGPLAANDPRIQQAEQFCNNLMSKVF